MGKNVLPEPGPWVDAVERIGLGGAVILILALGVGISIPFRGPAYIDAFNRVWQTYLKHSREKKRVPQKIKDKQGNLKSALNARKRNGGPK